jgi:hypothetical protein
VGEIVRASQNMHQSQGIGIVCLRIIDPEDALTPILQDDQIELLADFLKSLFPGNGFKPVFHSFQGSFEALRAV